MTTRSLNDLTEKEQLEADMQKDCTSTMHYGKITEIHEPSMIEETDYQLNAAEIMIQSARLKLKSMGDASTRKDEGVGEPLAKAEIAVTSCTNITDKHTYLGMKTISDFMDDSALWVSQNAILKEEELKRCEISVVEELLSLLHQPNPIDLLRWDVRPGCHKRFSEIVSSMKATPPEPLSGKGVFEQFKKDKAKEQELRSIGIIEQPVGLSEMDVDSIGRIITAVGKMKYGTLESYGSNAKEFHAADAAMYKLRAATIPMRESSSAERHRLYLKFTDEIAAYYKRNPTHGNAAEIGWHLAVIATTEIEDGDPK
jgi:hypothetical protein